MAAHAGPSTRRRRTFTTVRRRVSAGEVVDDGVGHRARIRAEQRVAVVAVLGAGRDQQRGPGRPPPDVCAGERGHPDERVPAPHGDGMDAARHLEMPVPGQDVRRAGVHGRVGGGEQQGGPRLAEGDEVVEIGDDLDAQAVVADRGGPPGHARAGGRGRGGHAAAAWSWCAHRGPLLGRQRPLERVRSLPSADHETTDSGGQEAMAALRDMKVTRNGVSRAARGAGVR